VDGGAGSSPLQAEPMLRVLAEQGAQRRSQGDGWT
jgi:hypothetical protein